MIDFSRIEFPIINPDYDLLDYNDSNSELNDLNRSIKSGKFRRDNWKSSDNLVLIKRACVFLHHMSKHGDLLEFNNDNLLIQTFLPVCIYLTIESKFAPIRMPFEMPIRHVWLPISVLRIHANFDSSSGHTRLPPVMGHTIPMCTRH